MGWGAYSHRATEKEHLVASQIWKFVKMARGCVSATGWARTNQPTLEIGVVGSRATGIALVYRLPATPKRTEHQGRRGSAETEWAEQCDREEAVCDRK